MLSRPPVLSRPPHLLIHTPGGSHMPHEPLNHLPCHSSSTPATQTALLSVTLSPEQPSSHPCIPVSRPVNPPLPRNTSPVRAGSQRGAVPMKRQALIEIIKPGDKGSWSLGYVLIRRLIISALSARNSILISPRSMARASSRTTRLVATTVPDVTERPRLIRRALNWC